MRFAGSSWLPAGGSGGFQLGRGNRLNKSEKQIYHKVSSCQVVEFGDKSIKGPNKFDL